MTKILALEQGKFHTFVIECFFGLQGTDTLRSYPCILDTKDENDITFYVWLADTDLSVFTKNTFMNLCNFAE